MDERSVIVIAEAGVNHNGQRQLAFELVDAAFEAGADFVKFQTFSASRLVRRSAPKAPYQQQTTPVDESQFEMLEKLELSSDDHVALVRHAESRGIGFLSTPFDSGSLSFLVDDLHLGVIKLPSSDLTNLPLLFQAAKSSASLILSTGMATLGEIEQALNVIAFAATHEVEPPHHLAELDRARASDSATELLRRRVTLLHCTSEYPTEAIDANLRSMSTLRAAFELPVGYSDHTKGIAVSLAAVALGASVVEKHLTLDRNMPGPDHAASCEPVELAELVRGVRDVSDALGDGRKIPTAREFANRAAMRKGIYAARDIEPGELIDAADLAVLRPGLGDGLGRYWSLSGSRATHRISAGDRLD